VSICISTILIDIRTGIGNKKARLVPD